MIQSQTRRQSNIELLRIISLFLIVCHHYVVNSGIMDHFSDLSTIGANEWGGISFFPYGECGAKPELMSLS